MLKLNGQQEAICIYPPQTATGHYLFYSRSKMVANKAGMALKIDDQINVSFQCDDLVEAKWLFEALVEKRVQVSAHKSKQSAIDQKTGWTYWIVKSSNSSTIDDDDHDVDSDETDEDQSRAKKIKSKKL